jgi:Glucosidase II beta subunit-like protein
VRLASLAAALTLLTLARAAAATAHVVIGEVSTRDPSRPTYHISLPELGGHSAPAGQPRGELIRMVTARGQALLCGVPTPEPDPEQDHDKEQVLDSERTSGKSDDLGSAGGTIDHGQGSDEASFALAAQLLDEYKGKCFRRSEGWWSYVFCYGVSVEQKHVAVSKDEQEMSFVLGVLDDSFDAERRQRPNVVSTSDAPYTQLYGNGTRCDVSGKPRQILVKHKCNQEALQLGSSPFGADLNVISAVREVETCVYEIDFVNSAICAHPAYRSKLEKNLLPINCVMEEEYGVFLGLASLSYKKSALNL